MTIKNINYKVKKACNIEDIEEIGAPGSEENTKPKEFRRAVVIMN